jgi:hypothetical protein
MTATRAKRPCSFFQCLLGPWDYGLAAAERSP